MKSAMVVTVACMGLCGCAAHTMSGTGGSGFVSPEEQVQIFSRGESPPCQYEDLGVVQVTSNADPNDGRCRDSLLKLQRASLAEGATGVILLDHLHNPLTEQVTGMAVRCRTDSDDEAPFAFR